MTDLGSSFFLIACSLHYFFVSLQAIGANITSAEAPFPNLIGNIKRWLLFKTFRNLQVERTNKVIMDALTCIVGVFLSLYLGFLQVP